ncbi:MAG: hypothetical protein KC535_03760 [Nanoarchaeota archaeon]|nr:hypothetical protein [Nanoarchaeota archaeon]
MDNNAAEQQVNLLMENYFVREFPNPLLDVPQASYELIIRFTQRLRIKTLDSLLKLNFKEIPKIMDIYDEFLEDYGLLESIEDVQEVMEYFFSGVSGLELYVQNDGSNEEIEYYFQKTKTRSQGLSYMDVINARWEYLFNQYESLSSKLKKGEDDVYFQLENLIKTHQYMQSLHRKIYSLPEDRSMTNLLFREHLLDTTIKKIEFHTASIIEKSPVMGYIAKINSDYFTN